MNINTIFNNQAGNIIFFLWKNEPDWPVDFVSPSITSLLGYSTEDFLSQKINYGQLIHPDDIEHVTQEVNHAITSQVNEFTHDIYRIKDKEGSYRYIHDHTVIVRDENDNITHFQGYIYDNTEMFQQKQRLEFVLEGTGLGLWDWNPQTNAVVFDERWANMLGYQLSEIEFNLKEWERRVHPDDIASCYEDIKRHIDDKTDMYQNIHRMQHKDGSWLYILDRGKVFEWDKDGNPIRFTGSHTNVTEIKKVEVELDNKTKELENYSHNLEGLVYERTKELEKEKTKSDVANKAKSTFLSIMSHELRTPLSIVIGMTSLALKKDLTDKLHGYIQKAHDAGENLHMLVKKMLDYSQLENADVNVNLSPINIDKLGNMLSKKYKPVAEKKEISFSISVNANNLSNCIGDEAHVLLALNELIENAFKFSHQGDEVSVIIDAAQLDDDFITLHFQVKDTGIGIEDEQMSNLFKLFTQLEDYNTRQHGGLGLGLTYAKKIIDMMHGDIWVESEMGNGSTFHLKVQFKLMKSN